MNSTNNYKLRRFLDRFLINSKEIETFRLKNYWKDLDETIIQQ